jgi:hypothetical protein
MDWIGSSRVKRRSRRWRGKLIASKKVDVFVYDGDRLVVRLTARPVRLMPDGYAGVVYIGAVYPRAQDLDTNLGTNSVKLAQVSPTARAVRLRALTDLSFPSSRRHGHFAGRRPP